MGNTTIEKVKFLGFSISIFSIKQLNEYILSTIKTFKTRVIYGHSLGSIALIKDIPEFYCYGDKADILLTDGRPFFYLAQMSGLPIKSRISIPEFVLHILDLANKNNFSVYILGASKEINKIAQEKIKLRYPGIRSIGGNDGYFVESDEPSIINAINEFSPNILLIGMPSPKKEIISIGWKNILNANIIIPCGGMIDVLAEKAKLSPVWIKKLGLASFYRVIQEPHRLGSRYLYLYYKLFFIILPVLFWNIFIKGNKKFSFVEFFKINNSNAYQKK